MGKKNRKKSQKTANPNTDASGDQHNGPQSVMPKAKKGTTEKQGDSNTGGKMKSSLQKLKDSDPDFYKFLEDEDADLLNFDESEESDVDSDGEPGVHKAPQKLEVASDDSDAMETDEEKDEEDSKKGKKKKKKKQGSLVTLKMVNHWQQQLQGEGALQAVHQVVQAFKAAVLEAGGDQGDGSRYKVEGSTVFNAIVRLCITRLLPAVEKILNVTQPKDGKKQPLPSTSKKWSKVRIDMKSYLLDMMQLMSQLGDASLLNVVLRHVHLLMPYYAGFPKMAKAILKKQIGIWSSGEETSRVLAFLSINKIVRLMQQTLLEFCTKHMYMAYIKNCKFTSPTTLPNINFMQRSLVEVYALDLTLTYQYAFIYIRQLAIHLRNAITLKKKDSIQTVYNWQYVHSLQLWARLLSTIYPSEALEPLIYPLTQVVIGAIRLNPSARFYPMRFHCVRALNMLSASTETFIPVLPFLIEVFELTDFNRKHQSVSMKPFNFSCIIKLSKAQLMEKAFKDGVIDQLYELLMDHFHIHAHTIGFPELTLPTLLELRRFLKKCKVANYTKQIKQIVDKVEETNKVITKRRKTTTLSIKDNAAVDAWERRSKEEGTPLGKYYATWRKLRDQELQHEIAGKERHSHDELPTIVRKPQGPGKATAEEKQEFADLFESDSDESMADEDRFLLKSERPAKKQKTKKADDESDSDQYSDFDDDELEKLAGSADEDEDDDAEDDDDDGEDDDDDEDSEDEDDEGEGDSDDEDNENNEDDSDVSDKEDIVEDFSISDSD